MYIVTGYCTPLRKYFTVLPMHILKYQYNDYRYVHSHHHDYSSPSANGLSPIRGGMFTQKLQYN